MKSSWSLLCFVVFFATTFVFAENKSAKSENSNWLILSPDAPPSALEATEEMQRILQVMTGQSFEIKKGTLNNIPEKAIWIGYQEKMKSLFPETDFTLKQPEEILIVSRGGNVALLGRDQAIDGVEKESGTANAIYTFLSKHLGVRWLWPGELGEDIPRKATISLHDFSYRFHPPFRQRAVFRLLRRGGINHLDWWATRHRLYFDSFDFPAGHAFDKWWERYGKTQPELFALQPDGTRGTYPENPTRKKLSEGEPKVWDQWMIEVREQISQNPAQNVFNASPNDSSNSGVCVDPRSTAWDHPDAEKWNYSWANETRQAPALTNRLITFSNILAKKLKAEYPSHEYYVSIMAYGPSKPAPIDLKVDENVFVGYVGHFPLLDDNRRAQEKAEFAEWGKSTRNLIYRPNITLYTGGYHGLPAVTFDNTIEDFRFLAENGCKGIIFDTLLDHWSTQGPMYYLMAELAWDPMQDGQAILDDYFHRAFGPAAKSIQAYFKIMEEAHEQIYTRADWLPSGRMYQQLTSRRLIQEAWSKRRMEAAAKLLDQAILEASDSPVFSKRVEFIKHGFAFSENLIATADLMNRIRESNGKDYEAVDEVQRLLAWREKFFSEQNENAARDRSIPPINEHRFKNTFIKARKLNDFLGPVSEAFIQAAAAEKAHPTIPKLSQEERESRMATTLSVEMRWTGKSGDQHWGNLENWETRSPDGWQAAHSLPSAKTRVILDEAAPAQNRTIELTSNVEVNQLKIQGTRQDAPFVIRSTDTKDIANEDSDSGMVYTIALSDPNAIVQESGTASPLIIQTKVQFLAAPDEVTIQLNSSLGALVALEAGTNVATINESRTGSSAKGELILKATKSREP